MLFVLLLFPFVIIIIIIMYLCTEINLHKHILFLFAHFAYCNVKSLRKKLVKSCMYYCNIFNESTSSKMIIMINTTYNVMRYWKFKNYAYYYRRILSSMPKTDVIFWNELCSLKGRMSYDPMLSTTWSILKTKNKLG